MPGGGLVLCVLGPVILLGLLAMALFRVELAQQGYHRLVFSWRPAGRLLRHSPRRTAAIAGANILVPLLASFYGLPALASSLGLPPVAGHVLHGLNAAQGLLGLALLVRRLSQPDVR